MLLKISTLREVTSGPAADIHREREKQAGQLLSNVSDQKAEILSFPQEWQVHDHHLINFYLLISHNELNTAVKQHVETTSLAFSG